MIQLKINSCIVCVLLLAASSSALSNHKPRHEAGVGGSAANSDLTKGLTDAQVEQALSDLSLADLRVLNKLLDRGQEDEYYSDVNGKEWSHMYENTNENDNHCEALDEIGLAEHDYQEAEFQPVPIEMARLKRESDPKEKPIVNPEYLKQLEDSFPREQDQNNHEDFDDKKFHIRIKRFPHDTFVPSR